MHDAVDPRGGVVVGCPAFDHGREEDLGKDCAEFAHGGAESMAGRAHAGGEDFGRGDEGCGIWAEVEEELGEHVEDEEVGFGETLPGEAEDAEDDGENAEAGDLNGPAADGVDGEDGKPVAWKCAGADEHDLANGCIAEIFIDIVSFGEAKCRNERCRREA